MTMPAVSHIHSLKRIGDYQRPSLKPLRTLVKWMTGSDPHPTAAQVNSLAQYTLMGDPLADGVVAMYKSLPAGQGRKLVDQALERGIESVENPPQALVDLFAQLDHEPLWLDRDKIRLGCRVSRRVGVWGELVLRNMSLMGGYLGAAAAKPLVFTGQLDRMTPRRLVETGKFWMDVTTPGGLDRFQDGFKSAVHVRMMHAQVRAMLVQSDKWKMEWGHPLNQADSMATILEFSAVFLTGLRALGFIFSKREREAVYHLWRYIGYLMGVEERILPVDEDDAMRALYLVLACIPDSDDDTRALGQALGNSPLHFAKEDRLSQSLAKVERTLRIGYTRYILGDKAGDALGLPRTYAKYFWPAQFPLRFASELVRKGVPPLDNLLYTLGEKAAREQFPQQVEQTRADTTFTPVSTLAR